MLFSPKMGTDPVPTIECFVYYFLLLSLVLKQQTMDKVHKANTFKCDIPLSKSYRNVCGCL